MKKDTKEKIMIISALITLGSGMILSFLSFFLSNIHRIDNSVLWYFAQTLMYAGSCFGIGAYIQRFKSEVSEKINETSKK